MWARVRRYLRTPRPAFSLLPRDNPGSQLFVVFLGPALVLFRHQAWVEHDSVLWQVLGAVMMLGGSVETLLFLLWLMRPLRDGESKRLHGR